MVHIVKDLSDPGECSLGGGLVQAYSGHASRQSLEIYSRLAPLSDAQETYEDVIGRFPA